MDSRRRSLLAAVAALLGAGRRAEGAVVQDAHAAARAALVREVEAGIRDTSGQTGVAQLSPAVRDALGRVPRHRFVPDSVVDAAYADRPLPIGLGQTIISRSRSIRRARRNAARVCASGTSSSIGSSVTGFS